METLDLNYENNIPLAVIITAITIMEIKTLIGSCFGKLPLIWFLYIKTHELFDLC